MGKYNNYKKYYETHKEQEKARTLAYYKEHREEILAKKKAKRDAEPKKVKLTPVDYQKLWSRLWFWTYHNLPFITGIMEDFEKDHLERKAEIKATKDILPKGFKCDVIGEDKDVKN